MFLKARASNWLKSRTKYWDDIFLKGTPVLSNTLLFWLHNHQTPKYEQIIKLSNISIELGSTRKHIEHFINYLSSIKILEKVENNQKLILT